MQSPVKSPLTYRYSGSLDAKVRMYGRDEFLRPLYDKYGQRFTKYRKAWEAVKNNPGHLPPFPLFLDIEPEYRCNLRCVTCPHQFGEKNPSYIEDAMSVEMFESICKEAARYQMPAISVSNNNEGLMQHNLFRYIDLSASYGMIDIFLGTNGHLLTEEMSRRIINSPLTRLLISIDAANADSYFKMRRSKKYGMVVDNIKYFHALRKQFKANLPLIRVSMVVTSINENEIEEFKEHWKDTADIISLQRYLQPLGLSQTENQLVPKAREKIKDRICSALWQRMTIRANGDVIACCHLSNTLKVGNIRNHSIHEIWHGDGMKNLRNIHLKGEYHLIDVCASCME